MERLIKPVRESRLFAVDSKRITQLCISCIKSGGFVFDFGLIRAPEVLLEFDLIQVNNSDQAAKNAIWKELWHRTQYRTCVLTQPMQ